MNASDPTGLCWSLPAVRFWPLSASTSWRELQLIRVPKYDVCSNRNKHCLSEPLMRVSWKTSSDTRASCLEARLEPTIQQLSDGDVLIEHGGARKRARVLC